MVATAVDPVWTENIARIVFVRAVELMLESQIHWSETVFAMTWPTMKTVILMEEIAVGHA